MVRDKMYPDRKWFIPICGSDEIWYYNGSGNGLGGSYKTFKLVDGTEISVKGPWHVHAAEIGIVADQVKRLGATIEDLISNYIIMEGEV